MENIVRRAFLNSITTLAYIILVVSLIFYLKNFPTLENIVLIPIAMLMLLVSSATITGFLIFGKPVMLYIDGKKKESMELLSYTIGIMVILTILSFISLIIFFG